MKYLRGFKPALLLCLAALAFLGACSTWTYTYKPGYESTGPVEYGHQTHVIFSYEGSPEAADEMYRAYESGISDDPRVQRFANILVEEMERRHFGLGPLRFEYEWLDELDVPRTNWGPLAEAKKVPDPEGEHPFLYEWMTKEGFPLRLTEQEYRRSAQNLISITFGRRGGPRGRDFLDLSVDGGSGWTRAVPALQHRNASYSSHGVMGIIVRRDLAELPPGLATGAIVTLTALNDTPAEVVDEIMAAALNRAVEEDEIVQFYKHASLEEFGDSDDRVRYYLSHVARAVLIKRPEEK